VEELLMRLSDKALTKYLYEDNIGRVQLVQSWGTDLTVVRSARVSFGKDSETESLSPRDKKLIDYLVKNKHTSTLEHCGITFKFVVPLFVRSQHHRHRTWSYNEISRRYTDVNIQFYEPNKFRTQHESNRQASNLGELKNPILACGSDCDESVSLHHQMSLDLYDKMISAGVCREQARGVLPQNMYTEYYGTCNLSNLLKFIDLRIHEGSQWEIQAVAEACLGFAKELFPVTVESYIKSKDC
jgi:thymidylate synthase (FAD)